MSSVIWMLLFLLLIKNTTGEYGCQKEANLQLNQLLINGCLNQKMNGANPVNLPQNLGFPPLKGKGIPLLNGMPNITPLPILDTDLNSLLTQIKTMQNVNSLPVNNVLNLQEHGGNNLLRLKNNLGLMNVEPKQIDDLANTLLNKYLSSPGLSSQCCSHSRIKNNLPSYIQSIGPGINKDTPTNLLINKNQFTNTRPTIMSGEESILIALNNLQNRNILPTGYENDPKAVANRYTPANLWQDISNNGVLYNDYLDKISRVSGNEVYSQPLPKQPVSLLDEILFYANNIKRPPGNGLPFKNAPQPICDSRMMPIPNNILTVANTALNNNQFNPELEWQQLPIINNQYTDASYWQTNMSPTSSNYFSNDDNIESYQILNSPNWYNHNLIGNENILTNQFTIPNSDFQPTVNRNIPITPEIVIPSTDLSGFSNYLPPTTQNFDASDPDLFNTVPIDWDSINVLNLGEFGNLPIINGLPVASIVETVTVLNPF